MSELIVRIYDYMRCHRRVLVTSLIVLTAVLLSAVSQQTYKEDISDFLPLNDKYHNALRVYQNISGTDRIIAVIQQQDTTVHDPDRLAEAAECFCGILRKNDPRHLAADLTARIDMEKVQEVTNFVYRNMPYFLTDADYARFDSLLASPDFIPQQLARNMQMLLFPVSGILAENFQHDPLHLFTPVITQLQHQQATANYEDYDGYIFSPDMRRAIVLMKSPFGASETEHNADLLDILEQSAAETEAVMPGIDIHFTGGPVIAVGNARQIKADSIVAVSLAVLLIIVLLFAVFRHVRHMLLIVVAIGWGWLFAMGTLTLIHNQVSVIVIGISSVILGIAVNYPLHLIAHLRHTPDVRTALKEIVMPLVVGNITTVGAFLTLVPLKSAALRDLGLFSSLLLIGTILFVLLWLPHALHLPPSTLKPSTPKPSTLHLPPSTKKAWLLGLTLLLTLVFGYYSLGTAFDSDINHINYMTPEQRSDMAWLQQMAGNDGNGQKPIYIISSDRTSDGALDKSLRLQPLLQQLQEEGLVSEASGCSRFLASRTEQARRLSLWQAFTSKYAAQIRRDITRAARHEGFAEDTFIPFLELLRQPLKPQYTGYFAPLTSTVLASNIVADSMQHDVIDVLTVAHGHVAEVLARVGDSAFDVTGIHNSIATRLSNDFSYIGWACGLIVFCFLWFSLGCIELALLSFLPMAVSWVWILGFMSILGIQFNVVNIILATFIFGQGDDYTIFMTEGCQYEYAYRRPMLGSYMQSIILSALIMLIGIGTLIIARHPALHSLAEVTIIGMFSVVLMAFLLPPLVFRWLVSNRQGYRRRPITLASLFGLRCDNDPVSLVKDIYRYKGVEIASAVRSSMRRRGAWLQAIDLSGSEVTIQDNSWGERALLVALMHPDKKIMAIVADSDRWKVAHHSAEGICNNLTFLVNNE